jgi:hypothetical protein
VEYLREENKKVRLYLALLTILFVSVIQYIVSS